MISEGSYDTEDWRNDAENSALHHKNKLHIKIYSNRKQILTIVIISQYNTIFTVFFDQINTDSVCFNLIFYQPQTVKLNQFKLFVLMNLSIYPSIRPSVCLSVYLSIIYLYF